MENSINAPLVVAVVGHIKPQDLKDFIDTVQGLPYFHVVIFKTSSDKLWIKEGDAP